MVEVEAVVVRERLETVAGSAGHVGATVVEAVARVRAGRALEEVG